MERLLTVEFGPSRSKRFGKAVALAQSGPGECAESEPGRYRVRFLLASEAAVYSALGRLLERVRHWRATEVYEGDELVSTYQAKEMAWCASFQLNYFGECRERFQWGVMPRCALCPLFDSERALGVGKREEPVPGERFEMAFDLHDAALIVGADFAMITNLDYLFDSDLMAVLEGEIPEWLDLSALIPDSPPEDWPETRPMLDGDEDA
ncbi:MAG TPA: hypothetical protein VHI55_09470 [Gaiellaceae bacterium]|jgi:hypothetical protein|nr:hypothetical protein [Gaiellaceae bacterium]